MVLAARLVDVGGCVIGRGVDRRWDLISLSSFFLNLMGSCGLMEQTPLTHFYLIQHYPIGCN